jgi:predicted membrane channel-forming protein YqfA (hemolysin III family)
MAILMTLSFALSASSMFILLRRWTVWVPAAWLGGLVYGFSSFALEEAAAGRITYVFAVAPPLLILVIDKLIKEEWPPLVGGSLFGLLTAFQLFVSEELLSIIALFLGLALLTLGVIYRHQVAQRLGDIVRIAGSAAVAFALFSAYPLTVQFFGADRITGPPQAYSQLALFSTDGLSLITPGPAQWIDYGWTNRIANAFSANLAGEVTFYVGIPLLVLLLASVVLLRRHLLVRIFAPVALLCFWCSMGPHLLIDNHRIGVPGIDAVLVHLPILGDIIPARFAIVFWFAIAVLFAVALDEGQRWLRGSVERTMDRRHLSVPSRAQRSRQRLLALRIATVTSLVVGVGVLIPLIPPWPYGNVPADVPSFFTGHDVERIPSGSLVATYPYALTATAWPMLWQADSNMRFRMLGGYAIGPGPKGVGTFFADPNPLLYCFNTIWQSGTAPNTLCAPQHLAQSVRQLGVTSVVAGDKENNVALAVQVMSAALGTRPQHVSGVWLWRCTTSHGRPGCRWR